LVAGTEDGGAVMVADALARATKTQAVSQERGRNHRAQENLENHLQPANLEKMMIHGEVGEVSNYLPLSIPPSNRQS